MEAPNNSVCVLLWDASDKAALLLHCPLFRVMLSYRPGDVWLDLSANFRLVGGQHMLLCFHANGPPAPINRDVMGLF